MVKVGRKKKKKPTGILQYDRDAMLQEYLAGASLRAISDSHGIDYVYLTRIAARKPRLKDGSVGQNWKEIRAKWSGPNSPLQESFQAEMAEAKGKASAHSYMDFLGRGAKTLMTLERMFSLMVLQVADDTGTYTTSKGTDIPSYKLSFKGLQEILRTQASLNEMKRIIHQVDVQDSGENEHPVGEGHIARILSGQDTAEVNEKIKLLGDLFQRLGAGNEDFICDNRPVVDAWGGLTTEGQAMVERMFPGLEDGTLKALDDTAKTVATGVPDHLNNLGE